MELSKETLIGRDVVIFKKDGFKKAGTAVGVDTIFIYIRFNGSGTIQAIPIAEIDHIKIEGDVDGEQHN